MSAAGLPALAKPVKYVELRDPGISCIFVLSGSLYIPVVVGSGVMVCAPRGTLTRWGTLCGNKEVAVNLEIWTRIERFGCSPVEDQLREQARTRTTSGVRVDTRLLPVSGRLTIPERFSGVIFVRVGRVQQRPQVGACGQSLAIVSNKQRA
eukprot:1176456-Prorocentrum_minimum.AAC.2